MFSKRIIQSLGLSFLCYLTPLLIGHMVHTIWGLVAFAELFNLKGNPQFVGIIATVATVLIYQILAIGVFYWILSGRLWRWAVLAVFFPLGSAFLMFTYWSIIGPLKYIDQSQKPIESTQANFPWPIECNIENAKISTFYLPRDNSFEAAGIAVVYRPNDDSMTFLTMPGCVIENRNLKKHFKFESNGVQILPTKFRMP